MNTYSISNSSIKYIESNPDELILIKTVNVKILPMYSDVTIPFYATSGSAGCDVRAYLTKENGYANNKLVIKPNETIAVPTGLKFQLPEGFEMQIRPRSGLSLKTKLRVANSPGTLDCVPAGTNILTLNGEKKVEDIFETCTKEKEIIYSFNEEKNEIEEDILTEIWKVDDLELLKIETEDGTSVVIPKNKTVFTKRGWVEAKDLTENDEILSYK